jgi:hypothetical protein
MCEVAKWNNWEYDCGGVLLMDSTTTSVKEETSFAFIE